MSQPPFFIFLSLSLYIHSIPPSFIHTLNSTMAQSPLPSSTSSVAGVQVDSHVFPPSVKPPGTTNTLFLGGAGARGLEIQGKFIRFTAIGVYLEDSAVKSLAVKWKGKTAEELTESIDFYRDVVTGPFEKFTQVTMILPLTGKQYSEKVAENCVAHWKAVGAYTDAEEKAIEKFLEVFKDETFPPGSSILFTLLPAGTLAISFSKDSSMPLEDSKLVIIENKQLAETLLESIIGKHGVSPEAKQSLAARVSDLLKQCDGKTVGNGIVEVEKMATNQTPVQSENPTVEVL